MFAATHIEKEVESDDFEHGVTGKRLCTMDEAINVTAPTLSELLAKIGARYCLEIDDVFISADDGEPIDWIGFSRLEADDGSEPSKGQLAEWKAGKRALWLADYAIAIERRQTSPVTIGDFQGVKFHR